MGEEVAAVAAVDEDTAEEALELIKVEYEPLPYVLTAEEAMREGAPLVHDHKAGERGGQLPVDEGDIEEALKKSDYVWEKTFTCDVASHALPEPFTAVADYEPSGKFNVWVQTQCPFQMRQGLHNTMKVSPSDIRVHSLSDGRRARRQVGDPSRRLHSLYPFPQGGPACPGQADPGRGGGLHAGQGLQGIDREGGLQK